MPEKCALSHRASWDAILVTVVAFVENVCTVTQIRLGEGGGGGGIPLGGGGAGGGGGGRRTENRDHILRLLSPKTRLFKAFGLF